MEDELKEAVEEVVADVEVELSETEQPNRMQTWWCILRTPEQLL